jgi:hypothetical protein
MLIGASSAVSLVSATRDTSDFRIIVVIGDSLLIVIIEKSSCSVVRHKATDRHHI